MGYQSIHTLSSVLYLCMLVTPSLYRHVGSMGPAKSPAFESMVSESSAAMRKTGPFAGLGQSIQQWPWLHGHVRSPGLLRCPAWGLTASDPWYRLVITLMIARQSMLTSKAFLTCNSLTIHASCLIAPIDFRTKKLLSGCCAASKPVTRPTL